MPSTRVNNFARALSDPQVLHRNMVVELDHPLGGSAKVPGNSVKLSVNTDEASTPPPLLGAHTVAVFGEWAGMSRERIDQVIAAGVLQQPGSPSSPQ